MHSKRRKRKKMAIPMVVCVLLLGSITSGQIRRSNPTSGQFVRRLNDRPRQGIQYHSAAIVKLASRKSAYRSGEIVSVDLALLNIADKPIFFLKKLSPYPADVLTVTDENGGRVNVNPYEVFSLAYLPDDFGLVRPGEMIVIRFHLLAGCKDKDLDAFDRARSEFGQAVTEGRTEYHKGWFERDLFVDWGDACLRPLHSGRYTITAEMRNEYVVVSGSDRNAKTAVGAIRSAPLTITIVD